MISITNFIIETNNRYNNKIDVEGKELIVNTEITERDYHFVNRIGRVINIPLLGDTPIKEGDEVIVHHNVFRRWYDQRGKEKNGKSFLEENLYACDHDQIFAYKRDGEWKATPGFCFVAPLPSENDWSVFNELELSGVMFYTPEELKALRGHIIGFTPNSEYEFNIEGQKLYRILSNQITIDYGPKKETTKNNRVLV